MKKWKSLALFNSPWGVVILVVASVLSTDFLFMTLLHGFLMAQFKLSDMAMDVINSVTLAVVVVPVLYFLVFRKIQESEERFRQINASAHDAIVIINEQGAIIEWNLAAQRIFQYSREEAVGLQTHQLIVPTRFHADVKLGFDRFQAAGAGSVIGSTTEMSVRRKDGSEFPVELSTSAVKIKSFWHAIWIIRDITERKQAESQLSEQLNELSRWHAATSSREGRILDLKHEVNELLAQAGQPPRYPSAEQPNAEPLNCGLQISDCGKPISIPNSEIRN